MSSLPPDWPLIRRITRLVDSVPGRGLHRDELGERLAPVGDYATLRESLMIAYRKRRIDFCGQYVVAPANPKGQPS